MTTIFLVSAALGGTVLVLQLLLGLVGMDHHDVTHDLSHDSTMGDGLELLTVRGVAAGLTFFGIAGLAVYAAGLGTGIASIAALAAGGAANVGVAALMRRLRRLESDGVLRVEGAIGLSGRVHVSVPGAEGDAGKILLTLQDRLVELPAVSLDGELPSGTPVTVVGVVDARTVEVVRTPEPGA